jgi:hypothetical protein
MLLYDVVVGAHAMQEVMDLNPRGCSVWNSGEKVKTCDVRPCGGRSCKNFSLYSLAQFNIFFVFFKSIFKNLISEPVD